MECDNSNNNSEKDKCLTYERALSSKSMDCGSLIPEVDKMVLDEIKTRYPQRCVDCICYALDTAERRVIFYDNLAEMRDYCVFSRLKEMSDGEAMKYEGYDVKPEFQHHFSDLNQHWLARERNFLVESLKDELKRCPSSGEIESAFVNELLKPGKSHGERFRIFYALAFKDKVYEAGIKTHYSEAAKKIDAKPKTEAQLRRLAMQSHP